MRHVLVHDRHTFVVHRDDERVAELPERNHRMDVEGRLIALSRVACRDTLDFRLAGHRQTIESSGTISFPPPVAHRSAGEHTRYGHRLGLDRGERLNGRQLKLRRMTLPQRVRQATPEHFVNQRLLEEPDLGFRRMHVHVDAIGRDPKE